MINNPFFFLHFLKDHEEPRSTKHCSHEKLASTFCSVEFSATQNETLIVKASMRIFPSAELSLDWSTSNIELVQNSKCKSAILVKETTNNISQAIDDKPKVKNHRVSLRIKNKLALEGINLATHVEDNVLEATVNQTKPGSTSATAVNKSNKIDKNNRKIPTHRSLGVNDST